jgi:hypothetical protein
VVVLRTMPVTFHARGHDVDSMPCSARNATSWPRLWATAHSADPATKIEIETTNSRRRP